MSVLSDKNTKLAPARLKISSLEQLFEDGELSKTEVICQRCNSPDCLWHLCLANCVKRSCGGSLQFTSQKIGDSCCQSLGCDQPIDVWIVPEHLSNLAE